MATRVSPGVSVNEIDLTQFIPNTGSSSAAFVGDFLWGPAFDFAITNNSNQLAAELGIPTDRNYVDWYAVSNFLAYTGQCTVVRCLNEATAKNATADGLGLLIKNTSEFNLIKDTHTSAEFAAKYAGNLGNSLTVSIADSATYSTWIYKNVFPLQPTSSDYAKALGASNDEIHIAVVDSLGLFTGVPGTILEKYSFLSKAIDATDLDGRPSFYGTVINTQSAYVRFLGSPTGSALATDLQVATVPVTNGGSGYTTASILFSAPPVGGIRATGTVTLEAGVITEIVITNAGAGYTSAPTVTLTGDGTLAVLGTPTTTSVPNGAWSQPCITTAGEPIRFASLSAIYSKLLAGGSDGDIPTVADYMQGWDILRNKEDIDVSLLFTGAAGGTANAVLLNQYVIDNIVSIRKDCVLFISPNLDDVLNLDVNTATTNVVATKNSLARSSSYVVMDSGWKLQMDVYANKLRWMPLNPDIAGLCASTDINQDPWVSPAGFARGKIKNCYKLAYNPDEPSRNTLYINSINPVVTFASNGTILFGDKTLQDKASAFSYINVRRLFLILEKTISTASKYSLFEFNDFYTQNAFKAMINPYLKTVQGRRGIQDFLVVCDSSNNTPQVVDSAQFVASIFIKPNRSINFIELNFIAVPSGVQFNEIVLQA